MVRYVKKPYIRKKKYKSRVPRNRFSLVSSTVPRRPMNRSAIKGSRKVNLRYCQEILMNPAAAGVPIFNYFRANSLFDPDFSGVGHQPLGFDQWTPFYNHYTVIGATITVEAINGDLTHPACIGVSLIESNTYSGTSTISGLCEQRGTMHRLCGIGSAQHTACVIKNKVAPLKFLRKRMGESEVTTAVTTNATEQCSFLVWAASLSSEDGAAIDMLVTIDYIVVFSEPKELSQS